MKKIDLENHFYDQSTIDALKKRKEPPFINEEETLITWTDTVTMPQGNLLKTLLNVSEKRKEDMEKNGITTAVISSAGGPENLEKEASIIACREANDAIYELTQKYPGQYLGSAILPVKDIDAAIAELERCVKELGFVAWHTHSNYGEESPDMPKYLPLFKKAEELGIYVYLHPQLPIGKRFGDYGFTLAGPGLGFTVDTMTTITKMIISGLFDEVPNLKVVLGHLGEAIPFLLERMDNRLYFIPNPSIKSKHNMQYYFSHNIMVTTSGNMSKEAFECAKRVLGIENICFGSDYPFEGIDGMMDFLDEVQLSQKEREMMFYQNAIDKLGIRV